MAEGKEGLDTYNKLLNVNYQFNDRYGLTFLTPSQYNNCQQYISKLRRLKFFDRDDIMVLMRVFEHYGRNYWRIKDLESNEIRVIAQKFIGKKNIRLMIFNRDGNVCLKCGSSNKLSLDHINPISKGGLNRIYNLQTLCCKCNSIKRDSYADYRK